MGQGLIKVYNITLLPINLPGITFFCIRSPAVKEWFESGPGLALNMGPDEVAVSTHIGLSVKYTIKC